MQEETPEFYKEFYEENRIALLQYQQPMRQPQQAATPPPGYPQGQPLQHQGQQVYRQQQPQNQFDADKDIPF